jgi:hypothetical protein
MVILNNFYSRLALSSKGYHKIIDFPQALASFNVDFLNKLQLQNFYTVYLELLLN